MYLPALDYALKRAFETDSYDLFTKTISQIIEQTSQDLQTRNNQYYFFIKQGLIESDNNIDLPCICGTIRHWEPPHDMAKIYCNNCGSQFNLLEIEGDSGYIITSNGPVKVIGSQVPDFDELPLDEQIALLKQCEKVTNEQTKE